MRAILLPSGDFIMIDSMRGISGGPAQGRVRTTNAGHSGIGQGGMEMLIWELVRSEGVSELRTHRAKVAGGWLVSVENRLRGTVNGVGVTFYPDPKHEWKTETAGGPEEE